MSATIRAEDGTLLSEAELVEALKDTLKPNAIAEPGTEGGPGFILAKGEWAGIQSYVNNALTLPTNADEFRNSIQAAPEFNLDDFTQLIAAYDLIHQHVTGWQDQTFPRSVDLAGRVYQYGSQKVPPFFSALSKVADELVADPENKELQQKFKAIVGSLQSTAQGYADEAAAVETAVADFATQSKADKVTLVGPNGDEGLRKYYNEKYGKSSTEVEQLTKEIEAQQRVFNAKMEEYDHDVIVASTTPTYAWIWPFGTIAAAVVAGVYGDKAVKALDAAKAAAAKIESLNADLRRNATLMVYINNASFGMNTIVDKLSTALPAIQKVQGVWSAMALDIGNIVKIIDEDIAKALPIIVSLGIDEAMLAWANVAAAANAYRLNAYIDVEVGGGDSTESHILQTLFLGR